MDKEDSKTELDPNVVWTLKVTGGQPFAIQLVDGPVLSHDGVLSVWNVALRESQATQLREIARLRGAQIPLFHAEYDRGGELRLGQESTFLTPRCPTCFWYDPNTPSSCGFEDWPAEVKRDLISKAWSDLDLCPIQS